MIDFAEVSTDVMLARGQYSTVRAAHEDAKKELQILCGKLSSVASRTLRHMQPDNDAAPADFEQLLIEGRATLDQVGAACALITSLAQQRAALKPLAWGRK